VKVLVAVFMLILFACPTFGQAKTGQIKRGNDERLGMSCAQVLAMNSSDWVAKYIAAKDATPESTILAIEAYGKCYDARTSSLSASLGKQGKGPLMAARGNFGDFESALKDFTAKALAADRQPADAVKAAYASMYEKQFRYAFYQSYSQKFAKGSSSRTKGAGDTPAGASETDPKAAAKPDVDPMTLAKNRFGELLAAMPEDKRHEIHAAFGQIFERSSIGEQWKLEIYRYAIFLLELPTGKPFSAPPF
jgi:hypothetical protein